MSYSYDKFSKDVLIRKIDDEIGPEIIHKDDKQWSRLRTREDYRDEEYCMAIYLGQECWEDLRRIDESEALEILREWGYVDNPPSEI
ncbi:MAG: hypothetical protein E7207_07710 [Clostridium butyricum]|nr:hypothetical protein [Clostridium butyricum]